MNNGNATKLLLQFKRWLAAQNSYTKNTNESYLKIVRYFLTYLIEFKITGINNVDSGLLSKFIAYKNRKKYAQAYIIARLSALSLFYLWAKAAGYAKNNPVVAYRKEQLHFKILPKRLTKEITEGPSLNKAEYLSDEEQQLLLNFQAFDGVSIRNKCIVALILATGLYANEIAGLLQSRIHVDKNYIEISHRRRSRKITLCDPSNTIKKICFCWINERNKILSGKKSKKHKLFFFTQHIKSLTIRTLYRIVSNYALNAGIARDIGSDVLRKTAIFNMLKNGLPVEEIQKNTGLNVGSIDKYRQIIDMF